MKTMKPCKPANVKFFLFVRYLEREANSPEPEEEKNSPPSLAETCIRELVGRASFGHVRCVLKPVLK